MKHVLWKKQIIKRDISSEDIDTLKFLPENTKWNKILKCRLPDNSLDEAYETFLIFFWLLWYCISKKKNWN